MGNRKSKENDNNAGDISDLSVAEQTTTNNTTATSASANPSYIQMVKEGYQQLVNAIIRYS